jgi:uncharacterized membrane protein YqjE
LSDNQTPRDPQIAEALQEISTRVSLLVSDEIALAKAEVSQKATNLGRGAAVGAAAGVFLFFALILIAHSIAWGIWSIVGGGVWLGYLLGALLFVLFAVIAGSLAVRLFKSGQPPVPTMAIAEAQATKQAISDARRTA